MAIINLLSGNHLISGGYLEVQSTGIIPNLISIKNLTIPTETSFSAFETTGAQFSLSFLNEENLRKHYNSQYWTFYTGSTSTGPFLEFTGPNKNQYQSTGIIISSGSFLLGKVPGTNFFGKALIRPIPILDRIEFIENSGSLALNSNQKIGIGLRSNRAEEKLHIGNGNLKVDGLIKVDAGIQSVGDIETLGNITAKVINAEGLNIPGFDGGGGGSNDTSQIKSLISYGTGNAIHPKNVLGVSRGSAILGGAFNLISGKNSAQVRNHLIINGAGNYILNDKTSRPSERVSIINGVSNVAFNASDSLLFGTNNILFPFTSGVVSFGDNSNFGAGEGSIKTGVKGVFAFGDRISAYDDNNVIFNDNRGFRLSTVDKNTFIINHLNGLKINGGGLQFLDNSHQTIYDYWLNDTSGIVPYGWDPYVDSTVNLYGPTAYQENGIQSFLWYMFGTNSGVFREYKTNVPDLNLTNELRDAYGGYVTGLVINKTDAFPINIGLNNKTYNAIVTATYSAGGIDLYGNLAPIPNVGKFNPTNNIIIGQDNNAAFFDIFIGRGNYHAYMTEDNTGVREKLLNYTTKTPCINDAQSVAIGWYNYMSGNYNTLLGIKNRVMHSKGDANIIGNNNQIYPQGYFRNIVTASAMPDGTIRSIIGGKEINPEFNTQAIRIFSNIFGIKNEISYANGFFNVIGDFNSADNISSSQIFGFDNYVTGSKITTIGQYNLISTNETTVLGNNNFLQYGAGHKVVGNSNLLRNTLFTGGNYPLNQMIFGDFNTTNQTSYEVVLGTNNLLDHLLGSYNTYIGNANYTSKISKDNSLLGNNNNLAGERLLVLGNQNRIDSDLFLGMDPFVSDLNDNSALEDNVVVGNRNFLSSNSSLALGNDIYINQNNTIGMGNNSYTYNYGQKSYSSLNLSDVASQQVNNINLGGITQKTSLIWRGISTGNTSHSQAVWSTVSGKGQEIYLNNTAYDENHNKATRTNGGPTGRAYIPCGRIWNGTLNITIANRGFGLYENQDIRTIQESFTVINSGTSSLDGKISISRNTISDNSFGRKLSNTGYLDSFVSRDLGRPNGVGLMISGDNINNKIALWVTGLNTAHLNWNVSADFLDTFIGEQTNDVPMLNQNMKSINLI
jgi:hypothetical protein